MASAPIAHGTPWNDRLFSALPVAPVWVGLALAAALLALLLAFMAATGDLADVAAEEQRLWQNRDARLAILVALIAAFCPTARRYATTGAARALDALADGFAWPEGRIESARRALLEPDPGRLRRAGWVSLAVPPLIALLVDRDPGLYFRSGYWQAGNAWAWIVGALACFHGGLLLVTLLLHARVFEELGRALPRVDLLDLSPLAPFAQQGLRAAVMPLGLASLFAANLVDPAFVAPVVALGILNVGFAVALLLRPMRGTRERVRAEKRAELARLGRALRGEPEALAASPLARHGGLGVADLLAWRAHVAELPEWPLDPGTRLRFGLLLGLPLASWLGGELVQQLLERLLDS